MYDDKFVLRRVPIENFNNRQDDANSQTDTPFVRAIRLRVMQGAFIKEHKFAGLHLQVNDIACINEPEVPHLIERHVGGRFHVRYNFAVRTGDDLEAAIFQRC